MKNKVRYYFVIYWPFFPVKYNKIYFTSSIDEDTGYGNVTQIYGSGYNKQKGKYFKNDFISTIVLYRMYLLYIFKYRLR